MNIDHYKQPRGRDRRGLAARQIAAKMLGMVVDERENLDVLTDPVNGYYAYNALIAKDRALIRAILMVTLRRKGQIEDALRRVLDRKTPQKARHLTHSLFVSAGQIMFLDIPDSAAVNLAVTAISEDRRTTRFASMANAVLRRLSREKETIMGEQDAARLSMPGWMFKRTRKSYGKTRALEIASMHLSEAPLDITVKSDPSRWAERLGGIVLPTGSVRVLAQKSVPELEGFEDGQWWVQDAAAALPVQLMGDIAGLQVADLCAAPGGKTAQLVLKGASVCAVDMSNKRLERLKGNLERLKLSAETVKADIMDWKPKELFDAVLLDAPCSSTGTIRRHPDIMWTKTEQDIAALAEIQFALWNRALDMVKPGGIVVFSNCSLDRQEGEDIYSRMLATRTDIEPVAIEAGEISGTPDMITGQGTLRTLPCHLPHADKQLSGMDGFFAARLRRI